MMPGSDFSEVSSFDEDSAIGLSPIESSKGEIDSEDDDVPLIYDSYSLKITDDTCQMHDRSRKLDYVRTNGGKRATTSSSSSSSPSSSSSAQARRLAIGISICFTFFLVELAGGIWTSSLALIADAFHLLTDATAYTVAYIALRFAAQPPTQRFTFGFRRAEILGAAVSVLLIWVLVAGLVKEAIERLGEDQIAVNAWGMLPLAAVGLVVNVILLAVFGLDHDHKHGDDAANGSSSDAKTINMRAAILHALGDLLFSIGVVLSSILMIIKPSWTILDPLCTFLFSFIVLCTTGKIVRDIVLVIMEAAPAQINTDELRASLLSLSGVKDVHALRVWCLTGDHICCSAHVVVDEAHASQVLSRAQQMARDVGVSEWWFQVEDARCSIEMQSV